MAAIDNGDLGFAFKKSKTGDVRITHHGKQVTVLRNKKAIAFSESSGLLDFQGQQQLMARLTGNYKRGNERLAKNHERNR